MRVLVLGGGSVGQGIAHVLKDRFEVTVADSNKGRLDEIKKKMSVDTVNFDISRDDPVRLMDNFDLISGALPGKFGMKVIEAATIAGVDLVDNSFMEEDFYKLESKVKKSGITVIPDCGIAPGLSNMIVGKMEADFGHLNDVNIKVGGLPETNVGPLGYKVVFSAVDTLDEFTREVEIVRKGKVVRTEPGEGLEYFFVNNLGSLEAFYTNGLRSLIRNISADNMVEMTVRYRGHLEKMKLLKSLGLLSDSKIQVGDAHIVPKEVLAMLMVKNLSYPDVRDILYMEILSTHSEKNIKDSYIITDRQDDKTGLSAMARTTGFTNAAVSKLLLEGKIKDRGIVAPELIGKIPELFKEVEEFLTSSGIRIEHKIQ